MIRLLSIILLLISWVTANAQTLSGIVVNEVKESLPSAPVSIRKNDSIVKTAITLHDGSFILTNLPPTPFLIEVNYTGYQTWTKMIAEKKESKPLGTIQLLKKAKDLKEHEVIGSATAVTQKGDSTQYNSSSYKTQPDAMAEDLLQKMPGITVRDGKVQAQGEDVRKVLVDGKPFFGDDPNAVLKNIPAEMIDKVQIFDQQTDQAQLTGFNDGNTNKTINIVTKPQYREGNFGKAFAGYGTDERYKAGATLNSFSQNKRLTVIYQGNNVNEQNFSAEDLGNLNYAGSTGGSSSSQGGQGRPGGPGGRHMMMSGGNYRGGPGQETADFTNPQKSGIVSSQSVAVNFSNKPSKKLDYSISYFLTDVTNTISQKIYREYYNSELNNQYTENTVSRNITPTHKLNGRLSWNLDSFQTIIFTPKVVYQANDNSQTMNGLITANNSLVSTSTTLLQAIGEGINYNSDLLYRYKFRKPERSISANIATSFNNNSGTTYQTITNYSNIEHTIDSTEQSIPVEKQGYSINPEITYSEPLPKKLALQITYNPSYTFNEASKTGLVRYINKGEMKIDSALSNISENTVSTQSGGAALRGGNDKLQFNIKINIQSTDLSYERTFPGFINVNKTFTNVMPSAMLRYAFTKNKNLRIFYRTRTSAPSIDQLQDVINNNNPLQLTAGNPNLKQDFQNMFFTRFTCTNPSRGSSFFVMGGGSYSDNYIGNSTMIAQSNININDNITLPAGGQLTTPVNLSGFYSIRSFVNYSKKLDSLKANISLGANAGFIHTPALIKGVKNSSDVTNFGMEMVFSSNISEKIDFNLTASPSYNSTTNSLSTSVNNSYFFQSTQLKFNYLLHGKWVLSVNGTHNMYSGLSGSFNQNFLLVNGAIARKLFKKNQGEIRFYAFDLLRQNVNIRRTFTDLYVEDLKSNQLQNYYMIIFTYNIRHFKQPSPDHR